MLSFGDLFRPLVEVLVCGDCYHNSVGYHGTLLVRVSLLNVSNEVMPFIPGRPDKTPDDFRCFADTVSSECFTDAGQIHNPSRALLVFLEKRRVDFVVHRQPSTFLHTGLYLRAATRIVSILRPTTPFWGTNCCSPHNIYLAQSFLLCSPRWAAIVGASGARSETALMQHGPWVYHQGRSAIRIFRVAQEISFANSTLQSGQRRYAQFHAAPLDVLAQVADARGPRSPAH
jgi:hypothetical protein